MPRRVKLLFLAATVLIHRTGHLGEPERIHGAQIFRGSGGYERHRGTKKKSNIRVSKSYFCINKQQYFSIPKDFCTVSVLL